MLGSEKCEEKCGGDDGAEDLRDDVGDAFADGNFSGDHEGDGNGGVELPAGDVECGGDHDGDGQAMGEGDRQQIGRELGAFVEGRAEVGDSCDADEAECEGADEFSDAGGEKFHEWGCYG